MTPLILLSASLLFHGMQPYQRVYDYTFLYNPVTSTFGSLKSSGDLKLIEDQNFKVLLSELNKSHISVAGAGLLLKDFREETNWNRLQKPLEAKKVLMAEIIESEYP